ncbi:MAG: thioesterase family protein [Myxococcota bacterium]
MSELAWEVPLMLPRNAFSARDAARAGDVWRACQDVAVEASILAGWGPPRYREMGSAFVVRSMRVVHHREPGYGERLVGRTWVSRFRRNTLSTREVRIRGVQGPVASATQEWVHVDGAMRPCRAPADLVAAFPEHEEDASVVLPEVEERPGPLHRFAFRVWHTWMDPLDHVNHPAYLDWCDEGTCIVMQRAGLAPVALKPVAEKLTFRTGAVADERVTVESRRIGVTGAGAVAVGHRVLKDDGTLCADGVTVRTLVDGDSALLVDAFE